MKKRWYAILLIVLAGISLSGCKRNSTENNSAIPSISSKADKTVKEFCFTKPDYFYTKDTSIEIGCPKPGKVYYTTDGTDPDKNQILYKEPIKLIANMDTKATVIKAKAYYDDGTESDIIIHTYFVGNNVKKRFDTLIFSVTTNPYNLFDYEHGIFVEGKLRDDYIAKNPGVEIDPDDPANFNIRGKEGEREVYLEVFEPDGTKVLSQNAGIRTYGGWSRAKAQKSIKIFARKEYDPDNKKLRYEFFPDRTSVTGDIIDSYKQLVLRNCGNDNGFAFIRDELFQTLAGQAGYDHEAVRPAAMFVNGEYRGFFWMHEIYNDQYFKNHYGDYKGSMQVLEGGELFKTPDSDGENAESIKEYEDMYQTYSRMDLTDDNNYNKLKSIIDVENYLEYYALNIYLCNEDWPHNNYRTYRYYPAEGENYKEAPFDGKWRYLLHDMDFSTGIYGKPPMDNNIDLYVGEKGEIMEPCPLFGQLMRRSDCREIFIKKTLDLINGVFKPSYFNSELDRMNKSRLNELKHSYGKNLLDDWVDYEQLPGNLTALKNYINERDEFILDQYQKYFGLGNIYTLTVKPAEGCQVKINSDTAEKNFTGSYYSNINTTLTAIIPKGRKFEAWLVNGEKEEGEELVITSDMIYGKQVDVKLIIR